MSSVLENLISGITSGSLYALYALGIAVIFGIMRLVNFAHGELIMSGTYAVFLAAGLPVPLQIAVALAAPLVLALGMERVAFRPIRGASPGTLLVTSFALSFLLQSLATLIFGTLPKAANIAPALQGSVGLLGLTVARLDLVTIAVTLALLGGVGAFLSRTRFGAQMRASAEDFTMARLLGVKADRVIAAAFAISGMLAGIAGFLLMAQTGTATPTDGLYPLLFGLVATVVGGLGSLWGAVLGGYLVGLLSTLLQVTLPDSIRPYHDAFVFGAIFFFLVFRPSGLVVPRIARTRV
ncbi:MAG TPA: branched-chain amino acid ABC transporter permease [Conexibacter sp.]|nr:branched-chain amino acid ABC transporter permease [Conexibacter sp.]